MLITKGGISRNIDKKKIQQYKDKGYEVAEQENIQTEPEPTAQPEDTKPEEKKAKKATKSGGEADGQGNADTDS